MARVVEQGGPQALGPAAEEAFGRLWRRSQRTLGETTLVAVVGRVLLVASLRHSMLSSLRVDAAGLHWDELNSRLADSDRGEVAAAMECLLVEFFTLMGTLTADVLSHSLHRQLNGFAQTSSESKSESKNVSTGDSALTSKRRGLGRKHQKGKRS